MSQALRLPSPITNPENKAFWEAAQDNRLILKVCNSCNESHYYPRTICPHCGSDSTVWVESQGLGEIYSYTVMRRGVEVPFAMAYVRLNEGVSLLTHLTNCDFDSIQVGQKVKVVFQETQDGQKTHLFEPL
ncbi:Zn-ribbon domain-containing OB-fold protein [Polynucleobacter sp. 15G-AUS-farblos]|uniref:Zn-ribbon domain-containing OB-fold protein n=1 Tax=Polynucleobacter sp. 15G-AUS-farblos TaxID=2689094 RepID=UPI001C0C4589|nr:Zn-ribbon domain-containing OB-fold protein [Polynucleobacter sp. 15G-AUS-farblos]MBU3582698.1 Zn-ribbon domain-containing OB-fold protein [Polynucleobacter sp. 15G-AUS-farblos]